MNNQETIPRQKTLLTDPTGIIVTAPAQAPRDMAKGQVNILRVHGPPTTGKAPALNPAASSLHPEEVLENVCDYIFPKDFFFFITTSCRYFSPMGPITKIISRRIRGSHAVFIPNLHFLV